MIDLITIALTSRYTYEYLEDSPDFDKYENLNGVIVLLWIRLMLNMRIFKKTRHMIMILAATLRKGMPFAIILLMAVFTGAFSSMISNRGYDIVEQFLIRLLYLFGEFPDDIMDQDVFGTVIYTFGACLIAMNLYIAIVSDVYDDFMTNKELIELQTTLWMTHDVGKLVWFWNREDEYRYYHFCSSALLEEMDD